jgi:hypothetical protein
MGQACNHPVFPFRAKCLPLSYRSIAPVGKPKAPDGLHFEENTEMAGSCRQEIFGEGPEPRSAGPRCGDLDGSRHVSCWPNPNKIQAMRRVQPNRRAMGAAQIRHGRPKCQKLKQGQNTKARPAPCETLGGSGPFRTRAATMPEGPAHRLAACFSGRGISILAKAH